MKTTERNEQRPEGPSKVEIELLTNTVLILEKKVGEKKIIKLGALVFDLRGHPVNLVRI